MSSRVLTTDTARQAVTALQGSIDGLREQVSRLNQHGQTLSQPDVWDGPKAIQFRGEVWPNAKQTLDRMTTDLEQLRRTIHQINADIMTAGS